MRCKSGNPSNTLVQVIDWIIEVEAFEKVMTGMNISVAKVTQLGYTINSFGNSRKKKFS
jgi:hypothetical protein